MPEITVISVSGSALNLLRTQAREWPEIRLRLHYVGDAAFTQKQWGRVLADLEEPEVVLLDLMGAPQDFCGLVQERLQGFTGQVAVLNSSLSSLRFLTRLGRFSMKSMGRMAAKGGPPDMAKMQAMMDKAEKLGRSMPLGPLRDMRNFLWLVKYWLFADADNMADLLRLLGREYLKIKDRPKPRPPRTLEELTIFHPGQGRAFGSWAGYAEAKPPQPGLPSVILVFYNNNYPLNTHPAVSALLDAWQDRFNLVPLAANRLMGPDLDRFKELLAAIDPPVEGIVNLLSFRLGAGPMGGEADRATDLLAQLGLPLFHPFFLTKQTQADWAAQPRGANPGEFLISLFLPELDGAVETAVLGAMGAAGDQGGELSLIPERVEKYGRRLESWLRLRRKQNKDKRVALILYDYPPGEANLGTAAFLDVFQSLAAILARLKADGFDTEALGAEELRRAFITQGRVNSAQWSPPESRAGLPLVSQAQYQEWTEDFTPAGEVDRAWGQFPGPVMSWEGRVALPGLICGKVFIGLQPSRGGFEDPARSYHDKSLPPHHQYLAFYNWLERGFRADALVHLGTHGTLEFLPGKETALGGDCFPDWLIGGLPHLYVYYSGNPAEAMIAKRRTLGTLVGHMPPPYTQAGSHGLQARLEDLLLEEDEAKSLDSGRVPLIQGQIKEAAQELGWEEADRAALEDRLREWRTALVPGRMHTLGQAFSPDEALDHLAQAAQVGRGRWTGLSVFLGGQDEARLRDWIRKHVLDQEPLLPDRDTPQARELVRLGRDMAAALMQNQELDLLATGLSGKYIPAGMGGDAFRSPEVLPTGRNLYQFDPRRVPSPSAVEQGREMAANTLEAYGAGESYPASVAVVLWGLETAKTQGETVAQILAFLGLELVRDRTLWEPKLEVIPLDRLGRPRVDVTVQMCGFFRDMFPNLVILLARAFELAAGLEEPESMNFVRAKTLALERDLLSAGHNPSKARELASARLFGPTASQYGTALTQLVKSRSWTVEGDLVSSYVDSLCHVYTADEYGREMPGLLRGNLRRVELVSQVRSSMDYEITDLDHYYEFLGGLSRTVREASGRPPLVMVSDATMGRTRTEEIGESIRRGVGTRLLNPRWLEGMLAHQHHGGQQLAARLENLVGLSATTGRVDPRIYDQVAETLVLDPELRRRIGDNNRFALKEIIERLLEAESRGYWEASPDRLERLKEAYLETEALLEAESEKWFDNP